MSMCLYLRNEDGQMKKDKNKKKVLGIMISHPENLMWVIYLLLASLSGIIGIINHGLDYFNTGDLYFISISIIAPLLADFIIQNLEYKLQKVDNKFLTRKTLTLGACIIVLVLCIIGLVTNLKSSIVFQLLCYVVSIGISLYMFCLQKLYLYGGEYNHLDDTPYHENINQESEQIQEEQKNLTSIKNDDKEIKL